MSQRSLVDSDPEIIQDVYLSLLQNALLGKFTPMSELVPKPTRKAGRLVNKLVNGRSAEVGILVREDVVGLEKGETWPRHATTMIGRRRLDNIRSCIEDVIQNDVPGDMIETGVWRGGGSIFMRGVLKAWNVIDRTIWVADSFEGLPKPDVDTYAADATAFPFHEYSGTLGVSLEEVRANFERFGLLDDQVQFLKGWFKDTLPPLRDHQWSVIRLDGDLYESTIQALDALYPGLSPGGWCIVDDYKWVPVCAQATDDYRRKHEINAPIVEIDNAGVCWQKRG